MINFNVRGKKNNQTSVSDADREIPTLGSTDYFRHYLFTLGLEYICLNRRSMLDSICPPVWRNNPRALGSGLSSVLADIPFSVLLEAYDPVQTLHVMGYLVLKKCVPGKCATSKIFPPKGTKKTIGHLVSQSSTWQFVPCPNRQPYIVGRKTTTRCLQLYGTAKLH